jgi:hypothetical protein
VGAGMVFLAALQLVLVAQAVVSGDEIGPLPPSETISLFSGTLTAAGLSAIYLQVRTAAKENAQATAAAEQRSKDVALAFALRADQLHAEFNTIEMREHRNIAYEYLEFLKADALERRQYAEYWVRETGTPRIPTQPQERTTPVELRRYGWALSCMIAFFVRVETHIRSTSLLQELSEDQMREMVGPFVWKYWERVGLVAFANECETVYEENPGAAPERPYFVEALRSLARRAH